MNYYTLTLASLLPIEFATEELEDEGFKVLSVKKQKMDYDKEIKEIITLLNKLTGCNYDYTKKSASTKVRERLIEGATVESCKQVVARLCSMWNNTKQATYLRPKTLFGKENFWEYHGQLGTPLVVG